MKDFLGSFASGLGGLVQSYIFPAIVAAGLWAFVVLPDTDVGSDGFYSTLNDLSANQGAITLAASAVVLSLLLGVVAASALRLLEGYWWGRGTTKGLGRLWKRRTKALHRRRQKAIKVINEAGIDSSRSSMARRAQAGGELARFPAYPEPTMPTLLGNRLRAGYLDSGSA